MFHRWHTSGQNGFSNRGKMVNMTDPARTDPVKYQEKLWPSWWIWLVVILIGASFSTIVFPIGAGVGFTVMILGAVLGAVVLVALTPRIEVTDEWIRAGRAQMERKYLGHVVGHRGPAAREQLGPGFDARSYQVIRGWIDPVVTAEVTDPRDRTPYWLISTRRPEQLIAALGSQEEIRRTGVSIQED